MTVAWQGNLTTTTVTLEKYNNDFNKSEKSFKTVIPLMPDNGNNTWVEKRWVPFMYFIVAKISFLLSEELIDGSPYKYRFE